MPLETKLTVLSRISKKSVREAEKITISMSSVPEQMTPDRVRAVSGESVELKFLAKPELMKKIERMKGLLAHKHPNLSLGELFELLCDLGLKEFDPSQTGLSRVRKSESALGAEPHRAADRRKSGLRKSSDSFSAKPDETAASSKLCVKQKEDGAMLETQQKLRAEVERQAEARVKAKERGQGQEQGQEQVQEKSQDQKQNQPKEALLASAQKISQAQTRREIFKRAQNQCENCGSQYALEIDHILPRAMGGDSSQRNLRVLCRSCNQRAAILKLGLKKMQDHINRVSGPAKTQSHITSNPKHFSDHLSVMPGLHCFNRGED